MIRALTAEQARSVEARAVADADIPAVVVAAGRPALDLSAGGIDDFEAARAMTRRLISLGHSKIAFIMGHPNQTASLEREHGYEAALREAGVRNDRSLIVQGYFSYRSGLDAAENLLARKVIPTAIFASNDDMAAAVLAASQRFNLKIPQQLCALGIYLFIMGFVRFPLPRASRPRMHSLTGGTASRDRRSCTAAIFWPMTQRRFERVTRSSPKKPGKMTNSRSSTMRSRSCSSRWRTLCGKACAASRSSSWSYMRWRVA